MEVRRADTCIAMRWGPVCLVVDVLFAFGSWSAPVVLLRFCARALGADSFSIVTGIN